MSRLSGNWMLQFRRPLIAALHAVLIAMAWLGTFVLRFDFELIEVSKAAMLYTLPVAIVVKLLVFYYFGLFHGWWQYAGVSDLIDIAKATVIGTVCCALVSIGLVYSGVFPDSVFLSRSIYLLDMNLTFLLVGGIRFVVRAYGESFRSTVAGSTIKRVLVVGAGRTGSTLVREMRTNHALHYEPVGFVDDDPNKQGARVHGIPICGTSAEIGAVVERLEVDEVLLAVPRAAGRDIQRMIDACQQSDVAFKTIPGVADLIDGRISVSRIRKVRIDDLLGREAIETDMARVRANTEGHIVLVTGAAGSIGSELSRQIAMMAPGHLILFDRSESDLHDLELMLRMTLPNVEMTAIVGDVLDPDDLRQTFERHRPSRVYHAAAYKHVALMERHIVSAVRNNVLGTYHVAAAAEHHGAEQFVLISTDKAVRPTSLMGASKRAAERVLLSMGDGRTRFTAVRFGNVLGSRGSVVPIFTRQIEMGGPVTVTHPDVVRFFMTIPEAVQLVLQSSAMSSGGDIFHLDMGEPVRIADLATNMIRLSGLEPGRDVEIRFVGLRSGEKLYEELLINGEEVAPTDHPRIRAVRAVDPGVSQAWIDAVVRAADARDRAGVLSLIRTAVPEYVPSDLVQRVEGSPVIGDQGPK